MIVGAFVLPAVTPGMTLASATRKRPIPNRSRESQPKRWVDGLIVIYALIMGAIG